VRIAGALTERLRTDSCRTWPRSLAGFLDELLEIELPSSEAVFTLLGIVAEEIRRLAGGRPCPLGDPLDRLLASWDPARPPRELLALFRHTYLREADADSCDDRECSARIRDLVGFIDDHFAEPLTLEELARRVHLQKNYAATLFRRETGVSIHRYLTRVRIARAAALLRDGEKVEAVMLLVGYRSKKSFYHQFRAEMNVTPGAYRAAREVDARAS
jgi:AraC-like DNA-binding protein